MRAAYPPWRRSDASVRPATPRAAASDEHDQRRDEQRAHQEGVDEQAERHRQRELAKRPQRHDGQQREGDRQHGRRW